MFEKMKTSLFRDVMSIGEQVSELQIEDIEEGEGVCIFISDKKGIFNFTSNRLNLIQISQLIEAMNKLKGELETNVIKHTLRKHEAT